MLKKFLERPVLLQVGASQLRFKNARELEFALSGKTSLSSNQVATLGSLNDAGLARELDAYQEMEKRIVSALSRPGNGMDAFLGELTPQDVSDDHDWREIFAALGTVNGIGEDCKRSALLKYVEYLTSGQEVIRTIRANRLGGIMSASPRVTPDQSAGRSERQALVFDLAELAGIDNADAQRGNADFARIAKGESLAIQFGPHQSLSLLLAKYRFVLVSGNPFLLFDETGHDLKIRVGKNIIGRSAQCDVVLDAAYGAVSRKHLIAEIDESGTVKLTDISTLGTFVPKAYADTRFH